MKRHTRFIMLFACGLLAAGTPATAQTTDTSNWFLGKISLDAIGRDNVASSKFQEYRDVPKGVSMSTLTLQGHQRNTDFGLFGQNVSRTDQRYRGYLKTGWIGIAFDYNQIPHNMGNSARSILTETAPGVWSMDATLRAAIGSAVQSTASAARTYDYYSALFAPTIAASGPFDLSGLRKNGRAEVDLGQQLPIDLKVTYMRDVKSGYRGAGGGRIDGIVSTIMEIASPLNEVTQDLGFRAALNRPWGNVYTAFAHNWYNNRQETTSVDYPYRATDLVYASSIGGPATVRFVNAPDNSANTGSAGLLLKFKKQTRVSVDVGMSQWLQNAQLYPYTSNSTILNGSGVPANTLAALDVQSANGKINTTTLNFAFSSRPVTGLGLRMRYRWYDLSNKTATFVRTGSAGSNPDRSWAAASSPTPEAPYGYASANPYGSKTARFDLQASYDVKDVTFEGTFRDTQIDRTFREATKGAETGWSLAAMLHRSERVQFRGSYDQGTRTASGYDQAASIGLQADESERDSKRASLELQLMPNDKVSFMMAYTRRHDDYPNRPNRAPGVDGTSNGLLSAKYDTYTGEIDLTPNERADVGVYYTYEKNISTTRYGGTGSAANAPYSPLSSMLTFDGSDKTNTFGANAHIVMVPDKWTFNLNAQRQKLDGLMAITGDPTGSFALARAAYGGIQDITDYNDTQLQTIAAHLDCAIAAALDLTFGYNYEKYVFADAYSTVNNQAFPASGGFYLKANDGSYTANIVYTKLTYRW